MKKAVYTVITGDYDDLKEPTVKSENVDYICFTDNPDLTSDSWNIRQLEYVMDSISKSRKPKLCPHELLSDYDLTLYLDSSFRIVAELDGFMDATAVSGADLYTPMHYYTKSIYEEAQHVLNHGKGDYDIIKRQIKDYKEDGIHGGKIMPIAGLMLRRNNQKMKAFGKRWWAEWLKYPSRDMLSLVKVMQLPATDINHEYIPNAYWNNIFKFEGHKEKFPPVYHITPFSPGSIFGTTINNYIEMLPEDAWICLRDGDTMFLTSEWGAQINRIAKTCGHFDLIGCMTNRIRMKHQLVGRDINMDTNVINHHYLAEELQQKNYAKVKKIDKPVAGLFMLFPKRTWHKIKFQDKLMETTHQDYPREFFDHNFCRRLLESGGTIGLAEGIYLFHYYRFHKENYKDVTHILNA
jgi:hypothetical protein